MGQLYRLPNGKVVALYDHPMWRPVKLCPRCNRMVSKWHEHLTDKKKGEVLIATSPRDQADG